MTRDLEKAMSTSRLDTASLVLMDQLQWAELPSTPNFKSLKLFFIFTTTV